VLSRAIFLSFFQSSELLCSFSSSGRKFVLVPSNRYFGVKPVTECSVMLYLSTHSLAIVVQAFFSVDSLILHLILLTIVWFNLSFRPFEKGVFKAV